MSLESIADDLRSAMTCGYCKSFYEQPIILPCHETICRKDLANLYTKSDDTKIRSVKCPFCPNLHEEPVSGFAEDKKTQAVLKQFGIHSNGSETNGVGGSNGNNGNITNGNTTSGSNSTSSSNYTNYTNAHTCCLNLSELYADFNKLRENPYGYIERYFDRVRRVIEDSRKESKNMIDQIYDGFIKDLKKVFFVVVYFVILNVIN